MTKELAVISVLLPPLAVLLKHGCGVHLVVNLFLTVFGFWIFGILHALFVISD